MKELSAIQTASFKHFIDCHDFFFIAGHKEPDGDCVSSCLSLSMLLEKCQKPFQLLSAGPFKRTEIKAYEKQFSSAMRFLSDEERKRSALIIVDCNEVKRLGEIEGDITGLDTFIIDHHKSATESLTANENAARLKSDCNDESCLVNAIIDGSAPAACCLVQMLYEALCGELTKEVAEILFLGLATDTGYFRFLSTDAGSVFRAAGRLADAGANPRTIYDNITGGKPWNTRKLLGLMLSRAERYLDGKLVVTYETLEDTLKWGTDGRDNDALYQALLSTDGVAAAAFLRQDTAQTCTGGFRSTGDVDVSAIAAKFGGGGHKNASGMSIEANIDTLLPSVVKEFARVLG